MRKKKKNLVQEVSELIEIHNEALKLNVTFLQCNMMVTNQVQKGSTKFIALH